MRTLDELFRHRTASTPHRTPLMFVKRGIDNPVAPSYAELSSRAESIAHLVRTRATRTDRVVLAYPTGPDFVAAFFGCLAEGIIAVPSPPPVPGPMKERFTHIVADCAPVTILTTESWKPLFRSMGAPAIATDSVTATPMVTAVSDAGHATVAPNDVAYLQYSSGTTRPPRGVMVTHLNALANCAMIESVFDPHPDDKSVGWMPHFHDFGLVAQLLIAIFEGRTNVIMDPLDFARDPEEWLRQITRHQPRFAPMPGLACEMVLQRVPQHRRTQYDLSSIRAAGIGAEGMSPEYLSAFAEGMADAGLDHAALLPCYGMAEAVAMVTSAPLGRRWTTMWVDRTDLSAGVVRSARADTRAVAVIGSGTAAPGIDITIVDPRTRRIRPPGHVGEILLAGANISKGYWGHADPSVWLSGVRYLPTGDAGALLEGELFVLDRLADLIVLDGRVHYPFDIERTVTESNVGVSIRRCTAFAVDDEVVIVAEADSRALSVWTADTTTAVANSVTRTHTIPVRDVIPVAQGRIPVTTSGKARRSDCRALYLTNRMVESGQRVTL